MSVNHKIARTANAPTGSPDEIETNVAQALVDLENNVPELKTELRPLQISAAREVDVRGGKKAIVIFVPVPQLKAFHKVQQRFVVLDTLNNTYQQLILRSRLLLLIFFVVGIIAVFHSGSPVSSRRSSRTGTSSSSPSDGCCPSRRATRA
jgi:hypothetical protein